MTDFNQLLIPFGQPQPKKSRQPIDLEKAIAILGASCCTKDMETAKLAAAILTHTIKNAGKQ